MTKRTAGKQTQRFGFRRDDFVSIVADEKERERLYRQSWIMAEYSKVLGERIAAFPTP